MGVGVEVHSKLTLHPRDAMSTALVVESAVGLVREVNLIDCLGILFVVFPATWSLRQSAANQQ
jgi:hypothetical protein